jgi:integrase
MAASALAVADVADEELEIDERVQLTLFDIGVDLKALRETVARLKSNSQASATSRAYAADMRIYQAWCGAAGKDALPARPDILCLFVAQQLADGLRPSTVERRLAAIATSHRAAGHPRLELADVRQALAGWKREHGERVNAKRAISVAELRAMSEALPGDAGGVRDRCILLLGFATGLRRADIAALKCEDVTVAAKGLRVWIRRSKTDKTGKGREVGVFAGQNAWTDPVAAFNAYLEARGKWSGPLFVGLHPSKRWLTRSAIAGSTVADVVHRAAAAAGLDASQYGAHSLRAGCVTAAIEAGVPESLVMQVTGHKSHQVLARYVRPARVLSIDVLRGAL